MSHAQTDSLGASLEETEFIKDSIEDLADPSIIGDAVMMARKTKPDEKKTQTVLPKAAPDAPPAVTKKILQKHAGIKGLNVPAKMSRENIGMSEKIEDYEMINQPAKDHFDIGTPKQTDRILQDSKDFLMHAVLLILVTTIGTHMVPISRYYFHDITSHFLTDSIFVTETELRKNFWDISLYDQIFYYFRGILMPLVYPGLDGKITASNAFKFKNHENLLLMNENLLVTVPRIRQVRVRNDSCDVLEGFMYLYNSCYFSFAPDLEDKEPFGLKNGTLWTYSDPSVTKAGTVQGDISTYTGGGYYMDFSPEFAKTLELYLEMWENSWIDHGTRAIIIDLASYTQRDNLFSIVTLVMELPPAGGVSTFSDVRIQRLLKYETVEDFVILGLELALVALLLLLTVDSFVKFVQQPLRYTLNLWNTVDWLLLALGYATIAVGVWRYWTVHERQDELLEAIRSKKHFSFYLVKEVQTRYENLFACFAFVAWLKTCRYCSLFRSGTLILRAFRNVRKELLALTVMLLIMVFGFAIFAHVLFGSNLKKFSTVGKSFFSLIILFAGGLDYYEECEEAHPLLAPFFFIGYIFVVMMLFFNWFVGTIAYGLKKAATEVDKIGDEIFISNVLKNALKKCLLCSKCRELYIAIDRKDLKKSPDSKTIHSLLDRYGFSHLERDLFLRRHGTSSEDLKKGDPVDVEEVIADLNGINGLYVEVEEHRRIFEETVALKKRLEVLDNTLADVVVKSEVLVDKFKLQQEVKTKK